MPWARSCVGDVEVGGESRQEEELGLVGPGADAQPADRPAVDLGDEEHLGDLAVDRGGAVDPGPEARPGADDRQALAADGLPRW